MAVDVMHLTASQAFSKMAFGKSKSTEELNKETAYPVQTTTLNVSPTCSPTPSDKSSVSSLMDLSDQEKQAVEKLHSSRKTLEVEIDVRTMSYK